MAVDLTPFSTFTSMRRADIAKFVGNDPRSIRAIEELQQLLSGNVPDLLSANDTAVQTAQSTADAAQTTANTAETDAQTGITNAASAQSTANTALTNAAAAQTTANSALAAANVQTLLNGISSTRGTVLYRGASAWSALPPGTSGQYLKTLGSGADPAWAAIAGLGGDAWTEIVNTISSPTAAVTFTGLDAYSELVLVIDAVTAASSANRTVDFSIDNGTTWETAYVQINNDGTTTSRAVADFTINSATTALSLQLAIFNNYGAVKSYRSSGQVGNAVYKASANPINGIRIRAGITGTNMTGGKVYLYGR